MRSPVITWAILLAGLSRGATQTLWPSELCQARALPDSRMTAAEGGVVRVEAGANYDWPGVCIGFKSGSADLSAYDEVRVALRNIGSRPVQLYLGFKNKCPKDWFLAPKGGVSLQPGESGEIVASLRLPPYVTDRPLGLVGMHGKPGPLAGEIFDLSLVHEMHISLDAARVAASFELLGIVVASREAERTVLSADRFFPFVDRFGQFTHAEWPGKIRDEAELRAARDREAGALAANPGAADWNRWGGWARGPQLTPTGRFRTEKVEGKWWLVDPDGRLFFSHGVDGVMAGQATGVTGRERYFAWLPAEGEPLAAFYTSGGHMPYRVEGAAGPYRTYDFLKANLFRKYGAEWEARLAETSHRRLRAWGLNTVANWSDPRVCALRRTPYVATVNGAWRSIANWCPDPFSPGFTNELHLSMQALKESGAATDPWCLGAFVDNEIGWGSGNSPSALAREVLKLPADRAAKRAFAERLQKKYADIGLLNAAWKSSFDAWEGLLKNAEGAEKWNCEADCAEFLSEFAERYFSTVRAALKAVAPDLLYLGCRFAWGPDRVYRAASRHCDVVSVNLYRHTVCKDLPEGCEDKPIMIGEFHFGAMDRGAFHTGLGIANNQAERAALYTAYLRSALAHPRCVGTHWFQWSDQPLTGRGDGENYPVGFVNPADQPYPELTAAARAVGDTLYAMRYGGQPGRAEPGLPSPLRVCRGLPEHMDIAFRVDPDGYVLTDTARVKPPDGYELWYMINSETVKTSSALSNYVYRSAMPLTIYKAIVRKGTGNLYPANQDDMAVLSPFSRNTSVAFLTAVFSPASPLRRAEVEWESPVPSGYDPSSGFVQWADEIEDMQLPSGKIWVSGRGQWPAAQMYRKGLTHLTKFDLVGLPQEDIAAYMRQGKAYDDVPTTPVQLSLQDKGRGEWVPKGQTWPHIWNTRFFPYKEGQKEPLTREEGAEIGRNANTAYSLVIFENSEQDHAIGSHWPFWRSYYDEWMPRMEATWKPRGVQHYVGHNYFSGIQPTVDWMQRGPAKEFLRQPVNQWSSPMLPGGTLEKSNLSCFGLYLGAPDLVKDVHYRLIFAAYANHKAGKHMVGFMQAVHEWRPNNFYENTLPEGTFYRQEKLPPAAGATLGLVTLAFVFGDGFIPFGFGGKRDTKKWVRHYAQGALWYPKGAAQPADLDAFPHWCPESGGYYIGYSGVEDMTAFAVRSVHRTFFQVEGGEARFLTFRIDGGPWVEAQNAEADDVVEACYDKRGLVYSKRRGAQMAVLYINPYADNAPHALEFKEPHGRIHQATVSTSAPHLALITEAF